MSLASRSTRTSPSTLTATARALVGGLVGLAGLLAAGGASAQQDDRDAVLAVLDRLFDGMRTNDGDMVRSVFVEGATLISTENDEGDPMTRLIPTDRFAAAVDQATVPWDEPIWEPMVHIRDHLATVWAKYAFYAGEDFVHCGVDTFILARQADGWKIASLADTRQTEDCEMPPDREPGA